ncbi:hypothetical protein MUG87_03160 [Ectobacillus sp. JY-23]|nr:hypothetical protein MUG87_03160 [Ectobacillus sp. JY-23]
MTGITKRTLICRKNEQKATV